MQTQESRAGRPARFRVRRNGFTLMEITIAIVILVALAGVAIPVFKSFDTAREERARADCSAIATALSNYNKDTRFIPTGPNGQRTYWMLMSDRGAAPSTPMLSAGDVSSKVFSLGGVVRTNTWNSDRWRGPYLQELDADPWGHKYGVWVRSYKTPPYKVWVVSAGKDGILQTGWQSAALQGDDIGLPIE